MTLYGTRLASRVLLDTDKPMEYWVASPYGWGYADNYGCDRIEEWTPSDDPTLTPPYRAVARHTTVCRTPSRQTARPPICNGSTS